MTFRVSMESYKGSLDAESKMASGKFLSGNIYCMQKGNTETEGGILNDSLNFVPHSQGMNRNIEGTEYNFETSADRSLDFKSKEISESDVVPADLDVDYLKKHNWLTVKIYKSLNPTMKAVNSRIHLHNKLLNFFNDYFYSYFEVDECLNPDDVEDCFIPNKLLLKPDLDLDKLEELPYSFCTSVVMARSLIQKLNDCREKCDGQHNLILSVMLEEIQRQSLIDEIRLDEKLSIELLKMRTLLEEFCEQADSCNTYLSKILMDETLENAVLG